MEIVYDDEDLAPGHGRAGRLRQPRARRAACRPSGPVLVDRFLEDATEVDVDAIRDATGDVVIGGDHGARRGGRRALRRLAPACIPPPTLSRRDHRGASRTTPGASPTPSTCVGLINVQYAVKSGQVFVIEANPRASRTVPFVAKATGVPLAKVAARVMVGATLAELRARACCAAPVDGDHVAVKEAVLPFSRFPDVDAVLGPEMRSTGEVMGIDRTFGLAFAKSQLAAGHRPARRRARCSCRWPTATRPPACEAAQQFARARLRDRRHRGHRRRACEARRHRGRHGRRPRSGEADGGTTPSTSSRAARSTWSSTRPGPRPARRRRPHPRAPPAAHRVPLLTTVAAALAAANGMADWARHDLAGAHPAGVPPRRRRHEACASRRREPPRPVPPAVDGSVDLTTTVGSLELPNPVMTASGTAGHGDELARLRRPRRARARSS